MAVNQDNRFMELTSSLSGNNIRLRSLNGQEQISRLFSYTLEIICVGDEISRDDQVKKLVGQDVTIRIDAANDEKRFFNGVIKSVRSDYSEDDGVVYRAEMVPALWFLTQTADCRIFQEKSIPDIIEEVFSDLGFTDYELQINGSYDPREYCVQYRETDFNFVSRLMEQYGMSYYFKHDDGCHTMVITDHVGGYYNLPEHMVNYPLSHSDRRIIEDHVTDWEHQYEFITGKYAQTDYNFKTPSTDLMTNSTTKTDQPDVKKYEIYDYPGEYEEKSPGQDETDIRMEEEEVSFDQASGASTCRTFQVGGKFKFDQYHPSDSELGKEYTITGIQHSAVDPAASGGAMGNSDYSNSFTCIPSDVVFRPARITPKPLISGLQTATVVGPAGEEIYTDEYGRIKVHFHWDRVGERNESDSLFIRVSHQVAGKKWGFFSLPRIGQEVVVDFLEGDPDRPLVVGSVYNDEQMPHYTLPDDMTKSYIKTNSSKGGEGFNEICFEDLKDEERIWTHAQKDMDTRVLNDRREHVENDQHRTIGLEEESESGNHTELMWGSEQRTIKKHQLELIEGSRTTKIGGGDEDPGIDDLWIENKSRIKIGPEGLHEIVDGDSKHKVGGGYSMSVDGDAKSEAGGSISNKATMDIKTASMNNHTEADMELTAKGGMRVGIEGGQEVHIKGGMSLVLEAGMSVCLKVGGNFINVTAGGIFIQGTLVGINSGGAASSGGGCSPQSPDAPDEPEEAPEAAPAEPDEAHSEQTGYVSAPDA